jgi:hypothetical protein
MVLRRLFCECNQLSQYVVRKLGLIKKDISFILSIVPWQESYVGCF